METSFLLVTIDHMPRFPRVFEESGIDIDLFLARNTRAASCTKAKIDEIRIDEILKTAGWSNSKTFEM